MLRGGLARPFRAIADPARTIRIPSAWSRRLTSSFACSASCSRIWVAAVCRRRSVPDGCERPKIASARLKVAGARLPGDACGEEEILGWVTSLRIPKPSFPLRPRASRCLGAAHPGSRLPCRSRAQGYRASLRPRRWPSPHARGGWPRIRVTREHVVRSSLRPSPSCAIPAVGRLQGLYES